MTSGRLSQPSSWMQTPVLGFPSSRTQTLFIPTLKLLALPLALIRVYQLDAAGTCHIPQVW